MLDSLRRLIAAELIWWACRVHRDSVAAFVIKVSDNAAETLAREARNN